jgi:hypothetical protein
MKGVSRLGLVCEIWEKRAGVKWPQYLSISDSDGCRTVRRLAREYSAAAASIQYTTGGTGHGLGKEFRVRVRSPLLLGKFFFPLRVGRGGRHLEQEAWTRPSTMLLEGLGRRLCGGIERHTREQTTY